MYRNEALHYAQTVEKYYQLLKGRSVDLTIEDWITIESWHKLGIPIECVLKGLDRAFTRHFVNIGSLTFCDPSVRQACRATCPALTQLDPM